jgi:hypothetical protein
MDAFSALQALAARQLSQGHPLQAIKCLEASLRLSPMPADEAQARLRAARLLLAHTTNLAEAKRHLQQAVRGSCWAVDPADLYCSRRGEPALPPPGRRERARHGHTVGKGRAPYLSAATQQQLLVQKLPAHHILKCEVAALLGRAHKVRAQIRVHAGRMRPRPRALCTRMRRPHPPTPPGPAHAAAAAMHAPHARLRASLAPNLDLVIPIRPHPIAAAVPGRGRLPKDGL